MTVLVAVASKHGGTREIAQAIAEELKTQHLAVHLRDVSEVDAIEPYDAVVLGSAVYVGHWLEPARDLATRYAAALAARPTWLFSSGPIGGKPLPEQAVDVSDIVEVTRAREHRLFGGRLDKRALGFAERAVVLAFLVPEGDFRDWAEIRGWSGKIAAALPSARSAS
jgi:menaquinone-dependent protoporphyrinogen oxidase